MADIENESTKNKTYEDIAGLHPWIKTQLKKLNIERPTPIQFHCIPPALNGQDVIGAAKTGSGKTLAFVIPILQCLSDDPHALFALVLTPTRELAFQIGDQFKGVGTPVSLKVSVIVGGLNKVTQGAELSKGPHVVIATPGRLADILDTSPQFTLKRIKFLVLDEADRLMDGRFDKQLGEIFSCLPEKRQTLLFSATVTDRLSKMKEMSRKEVFVWQSYLTKEGIDGESVTVSQLKENFCLVSPTVRDVAMVSLIMKYQEEHPRELIMIFTETCKDTQILYMTLNELGIECVVLHSMISQKERLASLAKFKSSHTKVLVSTDVGSRGLDIPMVGLVINHKMSSLPKTYVHRVGRTARAGRKGQAVSFIAPNDIKLLFAVEALTKRKLEELKVDQDIVKKIIRQVNTTKREQEIKLDETDFDERKNINKRKRLIMEGKDPDEEEAKKQDYVKQKRKKENKKKKRIIHKYIVNKDT